MKPLNTRFILRFSKLLMAVFLFIHIGAIFCVCFLSILNKIKEIFVFFDLIILIIAIKTYILRCYNNSITEFGFCWQKQQQRQQKIVWYVKKYCGDSVQAAITYPLFVSNHLIIINFLSLKEQSTTTILVAKDMLLATEFRQLKMVLKVMKPQIDG